MQRVAMLSVHTSPLAQPGSGDGGGMNVCVRALASNLARAGVACDVLTRADHPEQPPVIEVEPGFRVVHLPVGPLEALPKVAVYDLVEPFVAAALDHLRADDLDYDILHANYWISGAVGHRLKHELDLPLVATFHTLDRVKAEAGEGDEHETRARVEAEVVACADLMTASTAEEREQLVALYGAEPERIEIVPPGVDHTVFSPGDRDDARAALGLPAGAEVVLFAGRIQPLKGADLAVRALAEVHDRSAQLVVVGGPSGPDGEDEVQMLHALVAELGLERRVHFVAPQPHEQLVDYYRAADVCVVPSRTESFGLVALEAAACGTPVVAANVGGLRLLVDDGATGFLVDERDPGAYAARIDRVLQDDCRELGAQAYARSMGYRWGIAAARLRRHYDDLTARATVKCR